MHVKNLKVFITLVISLILVSCQNDIPRQHDDICKILDDNIHWYYAAKKTREKWGVPISTQLAIMQRESGFNSNARPKLEWLLGIIPWERQSTSFGYSQALDGTWNEYIEKNNYNYAFRNKFSDASDFIGWFLNEISRRGNIPKYDVYNLYLAYHVGIAGYLRGNHKNNAHLKQIATEVADRSRSYKKQLLACEAEIDRYWFYPFY